MSGKWNKTIWNPPLNGLLQCLECFPNRSPPEDINYYWPRYYNCGRYHTFNRLPRFCSAACLMKLRICFRCRLTVCRRWPALKMSVQNEPHSLQFTVRRTHLDSAWGTFSLHFHFRTLRHLHSKETKPARLRWKTDAVVAPSIQSTNPQPSLSVRKKHF